MKRLLMLREVQQTLAQAAHPQTWLIGQVSLPFAHEAWHVFGSFPSTLPTLVHLLPTPPLCASYCVLRHISSYSTSISVQSP